MWYGLCVRFVFRVCVCVLLALFNMFVRCDCDLLCDIVWFAVLLLLFWVLVWLSVVLLFRNMFLCLFVSYVMVSYVVYVFVCVKTVCSVVIHGLMLYGCDCLYVRVCVRACCFNVLVRFVCDYMCTVVWLALLVLMRFLCCLCCFV